MDEIIVQVNFKSETPYGVFSDALNIPKAEYDGLSAQEIEDRKQARIDKYVAFRDNLVKNPAPEPTKSDLIKSQEELFDRIESLIDQKNELDSKIASM